jgi:hypothetical protein
MRNLIIAAGAIVACLSIVPAAQAAPSGHAAARSAAHSSAVKPVLIKNDDHWNARKSDKQQVTNKRHTTNKGHDNRRYAKGDKVVNYVIVDRPQRYGLTRYNRYVQQNGYVYAVDPRTNDVLALIGLASRLLN